jgi:hypothetical protein
MVTRPASRAPVHGARALRAATMLRRPDRAGVARYSLAVCHALFANPSPLLSPAFWSFTHV